MNILFERKDHLIKKHPNFSKLTPEKQQYLITYFSNRDNPPNLIIDWNKLSDYDIEDIYKATQEVTKTGRKKAVKAQGIQGLKLGKDYLIFPIPGPYQAYIPLTYEASKLIASKYIGPCEGEWCTAYQKTSEHWDEYTQKWNLLLIYIITESSKYAVVTDSFGFGNITVFNAEDIQIPIQKLNDLLNIDIKSLISKHEKVLKKAYVLMNSELKDVKAFLSGEKPISKKLLRELILFGYDVSNVDTSQITDMEYLFDKAVVRYDISKWDVSHVKNMDSMFSQAKLEVDLQLNNWDVSQVITMAGTFVYLESNNHSVYIDKWNTSNVLSMVAMFGGTTFQKNISSWDVSKVKNMDSLFHHSTNIGDISRWNVSNVTKMAFMFWESDFNKDISNWDVSKVEDMRAMFDNSQFSGDISNWNLHPTAVLNGDNTFKGCPLEQRYPHGLQDIVEEQNLKKQESSNSLKTYLYEDYLF